MSGAKPGGPAERQPCCDSPHSLWTSMSVQVLPCLNACRHLAHQVTHPYPPPHVVPSHECVLVAGRCVALPRPVWSHCDAHVEQAAVAHGPYQGCRQQGDTVHLEMPPTTSTNEDKWRHRATPGLLTAARVSRGSMVVPGRQLMLYGTEGTLPDTMTAKVGCDPYHCQVWVACDFGEL